MPVASLSLSLPRSLASVFHANSVSSSGTTTITLHGPPLGDGQRSVCASSIVLKIGAWRKAVTQTSKQHLQNHGGPQTRSSRSLLRNCGTFFRCKLLGLGFRAKTWFWNQDSGSTGCGYRCGYFQDCRRRLCCQSTWAPQPEFLTMMLWGLVCTPCFNPTISIC